MQVLSIKVYAMNILNRRTRVFNHMQRFLCYNDWKFTMQIAAENFNCKCLPKVNFPVKRGVHTRAECCVKHSACRMYGKSLQERVLHRQLSIFLVGDRSKSGYNTGVIKRYMSSNESEKENKSFEKVKRIYVRSPYKWFDIKVKLLLMRSFFDQEFDENEFLQGARKAICLVSSIISDGKFSRLVGMLTDRATEQSKDMYYETLQKTKLKVSDDEIDNIALSNMAFIYGENGRKWVDILVTCHCNEEDSVSQKFGNVEIIGFPSQRIFNFAFVREFTPGVTADWIIDRIAFDKMHPSE